MYGTFGIAGLFFVYFLVPEAKGRTPEEVDADLVRRASAWEDGTLSLDAEDGLRNRRRMQTVARGLLQGLDVIDVYSAALEFHGPGPLQQGKGFGHGFALGADHGGELPVGVAGWHLVAFAGYYPLILDEPKDKASQAGGRGLL